ncbi:hypothetical protein [Alkalihalobacterium bogoriense]|uniref:hypothetical protein n=1 Tax=Alkalihalobacterium bogoriense TaxID=246272 RepID=UPI00047ACB36|nr:hypothetical protein [Alkalihalobacterium bogoriense]
MKNLLLKIGTPILIIIFSFVYGFQSESIKVHEEEIDKAINSTAFSWDIFSLIGSLFDDEIIHEISNAYDIEERKSVGYGLNYSDIYVGRTADKAGFNVTFHLRAYQENDKFLGYDIVKFYIDTQTKEIEFLQYRKDAWEGLKN